MTDQDPCVQISGYVHVHGPWENRNCGWTEHIERGALERAVAARSTVPLRAGLNGPIIGEATLSVDDHGLKIESTVDGFISYRVKGQDFDRDPVRRPGIPNDEYAKRTIHELSIEQVHVTYPPASPDGGG